MNDSPRSDSRYPVPRLKVRPSAFNFLTSFLDVLLNVLVAVSELMTVLVLTASWFPAHKVVAMEPEEALHYE